MMNVQVAEERLKVAPHLRGGYGAAFCCAAT
jgi:hypothetical protein